GRPVQPEDEAQKGRLAGAVGPEQPEHAAGLDPQGDVVEGNLAVLVNLGELVRLHHQIAGVVGHEAPSSVQSQGRGLYAVRGRVPRGVYRRTSAWGWRVFWGSSDPVLGKNSPFASTGLCRCLSRVPRQVVQDLPLHLLDLGPVAAGLQRKLIGPTGH